MRRGRRKGQREIRGKVMASLKRPKSDEELKSFSDVISEQVKVRGGEEGGANN